MKKFILILLLAAICLTGVFSSVLVADLDMIASFIVESIEEAERWTQKIQQWKIQYENIKQHALEIKAQMERWKNVNITDLNSFKNFVVSIRGTLSQIQNLEKEVARGSTICLQFASETTREFSVLERSFFDGMVKIYEEHDFKNPEARWGGSLAEGIADELVGYETYKNAWQQKITTITEYSEQTKEISRSIKEELYPLTVKAKNELTEKIAELEEKIHQTSETGGVSAEERETYLAQLSSLQEQRNRNSEGMENLKKTYQKTKQLEKEYNALLQTAQDKVDEMDEQIRLFNEHNRTNENLRSEYNNN